MIVLTQCPHCRKEEAVEVSQAGYEKWKAGSLIQDALPELSADVREQLITGYCGPCWNKIFSEEE